MRRKIWYLWGRSNNCRHFLHFIIFLRYYYQYTLHCALNFSQHFGKLFDRGENGSFTPIWLSCVIRPQKILSETILLLHCRTRRELKCRHPGNPSCHSEKWGRCRYNFEFALALAHISTHRLSSSSTSDRCNVQVRSAKTKILAYRGRLSQRPRVWQIDCIEFVYLLVDKMQFSEMSNAHFVKVSQMHWPPWASFSSVRKSLYMYKLT